MTAVWRRGDVSPIRCTIEAAFGADLATDPSTWVWTDITTRLKGQAVIVRGRADRSSVTQPAKCTVTLDNTDGNLTPRHPLSLWYLRWVLGTPMRIKVVNPSTGVSFIRCQGGVTEIRPVWPAGNSQYAVVSVDFQGVLYRLGQGKDIRSAMYRLISGDKPTRYWPMEDGKTAVTLAEFAGGPRMNVNGGATFATGGPSNGSSAPLLTKLATTTTTAPVKMSASITAWTVEWFMNLNVAGGLAGNAIMEWHTSGTIRRWRLTQFTLAGNDNIGLEGFDSSETRLIDFEVPFTTTTGAEAYGVDFYVSVAARQSGGSLQYEFAGNSYDGVNWSHAIGGSITGTIGAINRVGMPFAGPAGWVLGHLSIWSRSLDTSFGSKVFPHATAILGQAGDAADTRISNMATLAGVSYTKRTPGAVDSPSSLLGVIPIATPLAVMRDAESADLGILTDGLDSGVNYLPRSRRYNLPVALALNGFSGHVKLPFAPIENAQAFRNTETVSRSGGSSATEVNAQSVAMQGVYTEQITANLVGDAELDDQAGFRLNLNTVPQMRVPTISVDLRDKPELIQPWLDNCDIGTRFTATNLPSQYVPTTLDQIIEQYTETLDATTWRVDLVGSAFAPWRVFTVEDSILGRCDTGGSSLTVARSALATGTPDTFTVATTAGPIWTTAAGDFPFDIDCEGEQVTVANITGSSSPQTFTVTRAINGIVKAHAISATVSVWNPAVVAF